MISPVLVVDGMGKDAKGSVSLDRGVTKAGGRALLPCLKGSKGRREVQPFP